MWFVVRFFLTHFVMGDRQVEREDTVIKKFFLLCAVTSLFVLTGCWDKQELEERAYVVVIGIDKHEKENFIEVTFQIANPQVGSSARGDEANEPPSEIITLSAPDISAAKELANSIVTRRMSFRHLQTLIVGEELARSDFHHRVMSSMIIEQETRRAISYIVSKEPAKAFIHANKPMLETRPHKYYQYMRERWEDVGFVPDANLNRYFQRLGGELFLTAYATTEKLNSEPKNEGYSAGELPQQGGDPVQMLGSAVFQYGKMIGTLSGRETRISLALREKAISRNAQDTFIDPLRENFPITARITSVQPPRIKIDLSKSPIDIDVSLQVRLQMMSDLSLTNYSTNAKNQNILKRSLREQLTKRTLDMIEKTQNEFKAEPFLWHLKTRRQFKTIQSFEAFDWEEKYQNANVKVHYNVEIANFGEQTKPAKLRKPEVSGGT